MLYFNAFVDLVQGSWINAASNSDLWGVTLPQLARTNHTLRHAAVAIGALSVWHHQSASQSLRTTPTPELLTAERDVHYFHAIAYYCRSLRLSSQQASVQDTVLLSVLLLFFELLRGSPKAALDHLSHGSAMLLALLTDGDVDRNIADLAPNPKPLLTAVADIFNHLAQQGRTILQNRIDDGPPLMCLVKWLSRKKHTMESFLGLLSQLSRSSADIDRIPTVFNTLDEYEEYWRAVRCTHTAMLQIMADAMRDSGVWGSKDEDSIKSFYVYLLSNDQIREFCENSQAVMQELDSAFLPLFNRIIMSDLESPSYLKAVHLRLQYLQAYIFENPPQFFDVDVLRSKTPLFREYLSLAQVALRMAGRHTKSPVHQISLQCGIAWHLMTMALFCRDPLARDEAVWTLKDYSGQDGLWNTRSLYVLASRNRAVEQLNAAEGTATEQWQRLWRREFVFEDSGDRVVFRYMDKSEVTGKWHLVEETTEIRGDSEEVYWNRHPPASGSGGLLMVDLHIPFREPMTEIELHTQHEELVK